MKAMIHDRYGRPDVIRLDEVETPELAADAVLVRVRATALNKLDWYDLTGVPLLIRATSRGILRPKSRMIGHDFAGIVEAVGSDVEDLRTGDEVFGAGDGAIRVVRVIDRNVDALVHEIMPSSLLAVRRVRRAAEPSFATGPSRSRPARWRESRPPS